MLHIVFCETLFGVFIGVHLLSTLCVCSLCSFTVFQLQPHDDSDFLLSSQTAVKRGAIKENGGHTTRAFHDSSFLKHSPCHPEAFACHNPFSRFTASPRVLYKVKERRRKTGARNKMWWDESCIIDTVPRLLC
ncbi:hypothetical protein ILYODFUR_030857 [Ilyodon furcidens]|uniref:Secreted protein n=2 Tax=Goodeidae TaxID=28758 RepID=A0ABV0T1S8_9TELE